MCLDLADEVEVMPFWNVTWCMVKWWTRNLNRNGSISRGTSHATTTEHYQYTPAVTINNTHYERIQSLIQNHMPLCAVSLLESREQRYIKAMNDNNNSRSLAVWTVTQF